MRIDKASVGVFSICRLVGCVKDEKGLITLRGRNSSLLQFDKNVFGIQFSLLYYGCWKLVALK
jgi:hypothetical protein